MAFCLEKEKCIVERNVLKTLLDQKKVESDQIDLQKVEKTRLEALLAKAGIVDSTENSAVEIYQEALSVSSCGYKIIHKRDIDEVFVNNYNPEWILNWNANMDIQLCLDYYAGLTYISDYYSKDDTGTTSFIREALKQAENDSLRSKLSLVAHTFLTHRQIGESEAFYKILPQLNMKSSNIETVFVPTGFKKNRSKFLKKLTEKEADSVNHIIQI